MTHSMPDPDRPSIVDENSGLEFTPTRTIYVIHIADDEYRALMHYDCGNLERDVTNLSIARTAEITPAEITPAGIEVEIEASYDNALHRAVIARSIKWHINHCLGQREKWGT